MESPFKNKSNRYCSVTQCKSKCTSEISLFLFPKDVKLAKQWAQALRIQKNVSNFMYVCSLHFLRKDFILPDVPTKKRRLKKGAIPSQNLPKLRSIGSKVNVKSVKLGAERLRKRKYTISNNDSSQDCEAEDKTPCACPKSFDKCATMACGECSRQFTSYRELLKHIDLVHREDLISIFFPNEQEFLLWKSEMEFTTRSDFRQRQSVDYRELYVCTAHIHSGDDTCFVQCPAMLAKRLFDKGVQVFFHKNHNGHKFIDYEPDAAIEKYLVKNLTTKRETTNVRSDLHTNFKILMEFIVRESIKLDNDKLELLMPKAEEMRALLPSDTPEGSSKRKVDETVQVKNSIDKKPSKRIRNAQNESSQQLLVARKSRSVSLKERDALSSPMIVNTFTLADSVGKSATASKDDTPVSVDASAAASETQPTKVESVKAEVEMEAKIEPDSMLNKTMVPKEPPGKVAFNSLVTKSSFNDTYKDFIGHTVREQSSTQLAPMSPKMFYNNCNKKKKGKGDNVLVDSNNLERTEPSQIEYNDLSKLFNSKPRPRKKDKVKTKLGQFSPKKQSPNGKRQITKEDDQNSSFDGSFNTTKFQEYEVQERENDCNILILKF